MIDAAAACAPGTETVCAAELGSLGVRVGRVRAGVVEFRASRRELYSVLVWTRVATRIVVRMGTFRATDFAHLEARAGELDWSAWLVDGTRAAFRVTARKSRLIHTDAIAERLRRVARRAAPIVEGDEEQAFVVRADRDVFTVSADLSGRGLHRRTWRTDHVAAPLRPTMAAAVLLGLADTLTDASVGSVSGPGSDWPWIRICDPFAGSGTLVIEAGLLALGLPPDRGRIDWLRESAFSRRPDFAPGTWASVMGDVAAAEADAEVSLGAAGVRFEAYDRDDAAIEAIRSNALRAGVPVEAEQRVVSHLPGAEGGGLVVTNPPYGRRLSQRRRSSGDGTGDDASRGAGSEGSREPDLGPLYRRFGTIVRQRRPGWDLGLVTSDRRLARRADRELEPILGFGHGGLRVEAFGRGALIGPSSDDVGDHSSGPE